MLVTQLKLGSNAKPIITSTGTGGTNSHTLTEREPSIIIDPTTTINDSPSSIRSAPHAYLRAHSLSGMPFAFLPTNSVFGVSSLATPISNMINRSWYDSRSSVVSCNTKRIYHRSCSNCRACSTNATQTS
jgi:hypothetical protein